MRPWRKLHSNIVNSDKLADVSDGAGLLFCLLVAKQDDAGVYPNSKVKLRALTVARAWGLDEIRAFLGELEEAHMVEVSEEAISIVGGALKNGCPDKRFPAQFYFESSNPIEPPESALGEHIPPSWKPLQLPMAEEIREDSKRQESKENQNKRAAAEDVFKLYGDNIGKADGLVREHLERWVGDVGEGWVRDAIGQAVSQDVRKWAYVEAILRNWKESGRDREFVADKSTDKYFTGRYGYLVEGR